MRHFCLLLPAVVLANHNADSHNNNKMKLVAYLLWACRMVASTSPEDMQFQQQQQQGQYPASGSGLIQNPVVSCDDEKRKLLCLPPEYSKFDLPFRNDFNFIDIGDTIRHNMRSIFDNLVVGSVQK